MHGYNIGNQNLISNIEHMRLPSCVVNSMVSFVLADITSRSDPEALPSGRTGFGEKILTPFRSDMATSDLPVGRSDVA